MSRIIIVSRIYEELTHAFQCQHVVFLKVNGKLFWIGRVYFHRLQGLKKTAPVLSRQARMENNFQGKNNVICCYRRAIIPLGAFQNLKIVGQRSLVISFGYIAHFGNVPHQQGFHFEGFRIEITQRLKYLIAYIQRIRTGGEVRIHGVRSALQSNVDDIRFFVWRIIDAGTYEKNE